MSCDSTLEAFSAFPPFSTAFYSVNFTFHQLRSDFFAFKSIIEDLSFLPSFIFAIFHFNSRKNEPL